MTYMPKRLHAVAFLLFHAICALAFGSDAPIQMEPFRVSASDFYVDIQYIAATQAIVELRVNSVTPGSGAEKRGLRPGDRIVAIDGVPVANLHRNDVLQNQRMVARNELSFEGNRGFLRKKWSLTVKLRTPAEKLRTPMEKGDPAE
jgi:C-terminal processing protease CtpA/Prc